MLGHSFETPNVIDPGESAPARPDRRARSPDDDVSNSSSPSSSLPFGRSLTPQDVRLSATRLLKDAEKSKCLNSRRLRGTRIVFDTDESENSRSNNNINNDDDDGIGGQCNDHPGKPQISYHDDDDVNFDVEDVPDDIFDDEEKKDEYYMNGHDLLPSVEEARMYAASVLSGFRKTQDEEERLRKQLNDRYSLSSSISESFSSLVGHTRRQESRRYIYRRRCMRASLIVLLVFFLIMVIAVIIAIATANFIFQDGADNVVDNDHDNIQSIRFMRTLDVLTRQGISDEEALITPGTPQNAAIQWIADVDIMQSDIPDEADNYYNFNSQRFIQRYILTVFYFAMNGDQWHSDLNFLSEQDHCAWFAFSEYAIGVTCGGEDLHVKELYIPANNLRGTLPSELRHLSKLDLLSISNNLVAGTIPTELQGLTNLKYLDIGYNDVNGFIPAWIGEQLTDLKLLSLSGNNLIGSIPQSFQKLTNLITLALEDNSIEGDLSVIDNSLTQLQYLYLAGNSLSQDIDSNFLINLEKLRELDLSDNMFGVIEETQGEAEKDFLMGTFPSHLFTHKTLTSLDLSQNVLGGNLPDDLITDKEGEGGALVFLSLRNNYFTGPIPNSFPLALPKLTHLDLEKNDFMGDIPVSLEYLTDLSYLFLGNNAFFPAPIPEFLKQLIPKRLRELSLANSQRIGSIPEWLHFGFDYDYASSDATRPLRFLDLQNNYLNGTVPERLLFDADSGQFSHLKYLLLNDNLFSGIISLDHLAKLKPQQQFAVLALHKNEHLSFSTNADTDATNTENEHPSLFCDYGGLSYFELLTLDCENISPSCAPDDEACCRPSCCSRTNKIEGSSEQCFENSLKSTIASAKGLWENNFVPSSESFIPDDIFSQ